MSTLNVSVAPVRERGLKLLLAVVLLALLRRSREGARIEINRIDVNVIPQTCRSREGARIEIWIIQALLNGTGVAPVRERGLKLV